VLLPLRSSPTSPQLLPPLYIVSGSWLAHVTSTTSCHYSTQLAYKSIFFSWQLCQKKFLAYKSIRVITGHKLQANLLYNVTLHSTLSGGPSCFLHRFADMDNGTRDQNHRIPHNGNPDVATIIASCRRGHECRGDQSTMCV